LLLILEFCYSRASVLGGSRWRIVRSAEQQAMLVRRSVRHAGRLKAV
jgi:hypothetical protein